MSRQQNLFVEAFWRSLAKWERDTVGRKDDVLLLSPVDVCVGSVDSPTGSPASSGVAGGGETSATKAPPVLTGGYQCNPPAEKPEQMPPFSGGYDGGCRVSFYGKWFAGCEEARADFFHDLDFLKNKARSQTGYDDSPIYIYLDGEPWQVLPKGTAGGIRYKYQLQRGGKRLLIHSNPGDKAPAIGVVYDYESIFGRDLKEVNDETRNLLSAIGFDIEREVLSRVDINVTLGTTFDWVQESYEQGRVVSRISHWNEYSRKTTKGRKLETLSGGGSLEICVYDKLRQLLDTRQEQKLEDLKPVLDPFAEPGLTRVEFRFKRDALRAFEIESVEDFTSRIADAVEYLTEHWFRVLSSKKVRGRENRQEVSLEWRWVQYAFYQSFCADKTPEKEFKRRNAKTVDRKNVFRQALGCLASAMAYDVNGETLSFERFKTELFEYLERNIFELYKDYREKRRWFGVVALGEKNDACEFSDDDFRRGAASSSPGRYSSFGDALRRRIGVLF